MCEQLSLEEWTSDILVQLGISENSRISFDDFLRFRTQVSFSYLYDYSFLFFLENKINLSRVLETDRETLFMPPPFHGDAPVRP